LFKPIANGSTGQTNFKLSLSSPGWGFEAINIAYVSAGLFEPKRFTKQVEKLKLKFTALHWKDLQTGFGEMQNLFKQLTQYHFLTN